MAEAAPATGPSYLYLAKMPPREKQARLDGDTWYLDIDLGLRIHARWKVRLRNYSCPELTEQGGIEAKEFALNTLYHATQILIRTFKDRLSHDRWVADVWVDGRMLGDRMVTSGHATYTPM